MQSTNPTVYIAAPWAEREYARTVRDQFEAAGIPVLARWLDWTPPEGEEPTGTNGLDYSDETLRTEALNDLTDIVKTRIFVLLNTQKRGEETSGKAVEFGVALALAQIQPKGILVVGERTNVFQYLVEQVDTVEDAIQHVLDATKEAKAAPRIIAPGSKLVH